MSDPHIERLLQHLQSGATISDQDIAIFIRVVAVLRRYTHKPNLPA